MAWVGPALTAAAMTQKLMGDMEARLVMHVHGFAKRVKTLKQYPSLEAIAQDFAKEVNDAGVDLSGCPWELPAAESAPSAASAQPLDKVNSIVAFGSDGSLDIGQLRSVFGMGTTVALETGTSGAVWHMAKVDGQTITLVSA